MHTVIVETSPDAIVSIDLAGKITEWNPAAEIMFGYTRALVLGRQAADLITPRSTASSDQARLARSLKTAKGRLIGKRTEMTAVRANGGEFPIELTLARAVDCGPPLFTAYIRDLTERVSAEMRLRKSEERFRLLTDSVEDYSIHLLDPIGRVLTWNAGGERLEGYRTREIVGRRFSRFYTQEDIARGKPEQALITAGVEGRYRGEGWSVRKDGSRYWASVVLTALRHENGLLFGYSRIGCDRTVHKETEIENARRAEALEKRLQECTVELHAAQELLRQARAR